MTNQEMRWEKLLSAAHASENDVDRPPDVNGVKQSTKRIDPKPLSTCYQDVLSSSSFRALQDKTQVFSLDESDFIRTRLTHSLEVSSLARQMGASLYHSSSKEAQKYIPSESQLDVVAEALAIAGLLHDLGNPPFGHFGEKVISEWLAERLDSAMRDYRSCLRQKNASRCTEKQSAILLEDLKRFEGNAQTFRMLTTARYGDWETVDFPAVALATTVKYTRSYSPESTPKCDDKRPELHKIGYYLSEEESFEKLFGRLGIEKEQGYFPRHPLAFLLEAADDIAYLTADFEDAISKNLITARDLKAYQDISPELKRAIDKSSEQATRCIEVFDDLLSGDLDMSQIHHWATQMRMLFMNCALYIFRENSKDIISGRFRSELLTHPKSFHRITAELLREFMRHYVYGNSEILKREIQAKVVIDEILDRIVPATLACLSKLADLQEHKPSESQRRYYNLLPKSIRKKLEGQIDSIGAITNICSVQGVSKADAVFYEAVRAVLDYVSSLTDSAATRLYRDMRGLS